MKIIVSAIIGVVVFAAILVPVTNEAVTTEKTFTNEGLFRMTEYDTSAEFTAVWDYTDPYVLTVGDEEIALPESSSYLMTITGNDGFMVRAGVLNSSAGYVIQVYDSTSFSAKISASVGAGAGMTITVSGGTITFNNGTTTYAVTYTDTMFFVSSDGDYVMKSADSTAYVNGDSVFYGIGGTGVLVAESTYRYTVLYFEGTVDDGFTVEGVNLSGLTSTDKVVTKTDASDYLDLYKLTGVTFTAVYTDSETSTDYETDCTYTQIIVPYEVTAELAVHPDASQIALINIIPLLVLVGLVLGVVGAVLARRD